MALLYHSGAHSPWDLHPISETRITARQNESWRAASVRGGGGDGCGNRGLLRGGGRAVRVFVRAATGY